MNRISKNFEKELKEKGLFEKVASLNAYVGDIHNHCGISYGYGTIEDAVKFASSQLDFFSVTGHFAWPDMEDDKSKLIPPDVIAYHKEGFEKLRRNWPHYQEVMRGAEREDFIPFFSYEYHSFEYGDYTILCKNLDEDLPERVKEGEKDTRLEKLVNGDESQTERFLSTPHHIGYKQGYRGINWTLYNEAVSPLVEIVSMHGCAEREEARPQYLHTMGPRSAKNTYQGGLSLGKHFGVVGSTDHHNAAPGSYGSGRTVIFLDKLSRDKVWTALKTRHTSAASGDPIEAMLFVNGYEGGVIVPKHNGKIEIDAYVAGYDKLEKVEVIQNGNVIAASYMTENKCKKGTGFVSLRFGWGKKHLPAFWDVSIWCENGSIISASPRLIGIDMVDPLDVPKDSKSAVPEFKISDGNVFMHFMSDGNATAQTDSANGVAIETEVNAIICVKAKINWNGEILERSYKFPCSELLSGQLTEYVNGFVSPAIEVGRFRDMSECTCHINTVVDTESQGALYLRAYQKNGDAIFTSPISFRNEER
ncbi:MAG: hypothetical protein PUH25_10240 [Spirochaetales bacterium]|nr:hypothetical protein [Spirochaetales bacterium]